MTAKEREKVRIAINLIMSEDGFERGMTVLCNLVGHKPLIDFAKLKPVDLSTIPPGQLFETAPPAVGEQAKGDVTT